MDHGGSSRARNGSGVIVSMQGTPYMKTVPDDADFRDFFENGSLPLHLVSPDGTILYANRAELELLGFEASEYIGRHIADFYVERDVANDVLARLSAGDEINKYPAQMRARDGSIKYVEITSSGRFRDGELVNTRCLTVDVTELTLARQELKRQDDRFHQILESLPIAVYTTDRSGTITYYNRAAVEFAGREPKIGKDEWCVSFRLFTPDGHELPHAECPMAIALKEKRPVRNVEAFAQRPDGTMVPFLPFPTPILDEKGELAGAVNMLLDLTDLKKAEVAGNHLAAIVESSFDPIISKDLNGVITSWNRAAERLFGYDADEIIGKPVTTLFPADHLDEEPQILARIRNGERVETYETVRQRKDGSIVPVSLTISPIRNGSGRIIGASKIARDISAAKESERRIHMLMREVNHRVKNQYSVILSMIRETNKRSETPEVFERQVRERIMALSRSHDLLVAGDWKGATIFEVILAQAKPFGQEDHISMSGPSISLNANAVQHLGMAFHELATNSAKYGVLSGNKGRIAVEWSVIESEGKSVRITWTETDGPAVKDVATGGFGSVVLKRVAPQAVSGTADLQFSSRGIVWKLEAPTASLEVSRSDDATSL
jgi:PAS domain S-box-containing protein